MKAHLGREFGKALCAHFGIPSGQVARDFKVNSAVDEVFGVSLTINLTADDLAAIARIMGGEQKITIISETPTTLSREAVEAITRSAGEPASPFSQSLKANTEPKP